MPHFVLCFDLCAVHEASQRYMCVVGHGISLLARKNMFMQRGTAVNIAVSTAFIACETLLLRHTIRWNVSTQQC